MDDGSAAKGTQTMRDDEAIRADIEAYKNPAGGWLTKYDEPVVYRLAADVPDLLDRATTAEAEVVRLHKDVERQTRRADAVEQIESRARGLAQGRAERAESELRQLRKQIAAAEGAALIEAEQHREDNERGGCTCGFCAWSVEHVVVMSLRAALSSASTPEPCDSVCRNVGCTDDCQTAAPPAAVQTQQDEQL